MVTLLSAYMTTTGYLQEENVVAALPLPIGAILLALVVHLWPRKVKSSRMWPWFVPVYVLAGGPIFLLVTTWLDQHYHR